MRSEVHSFQGGACASLEASYCGKAAGRQHIIKMNACCADSTKTPHFAILPFMVSESLGAGAGGVMNSTVGGVLYNGTTSADFVMDADVGAAVLECKKVSTPPLCCWR